MPSEDCGNSCKNFIAQVSTCQQVLPRGTETLVSKNEGLSARTAWRY